MSYGARVAEELARAVAVVKNYGEIAALRASTVSFQAGVIHAVCGENGAGKSTLLKVVAGMVEPDSGHVEAFGSPLAPHTPREAIRRGIGVVLQHFALLPAFTALENILLGVEPVRRFGIIDWVTARRKAEGVTRELGIEWPLDSRVEALGVGDRQRLEIARALYREAKLLMLDEPTAVLTKGEVGALYKTLRRLAEAGTGIVVVTHKMDEVRDHADVVTVMRRGSLVVTRAIDRADAARVAWQVDEVTALIMGAPHRPGGEPKGAAVRAAVHAAVNTDAAEAANAAETGRVLLTVDEVHSGRALDGVSFHLCAFEIVGLAGVEGNGQRELVALLAGDRAPDRGTITGQQTSVVREDRQGEGLVLDASLRDNLVLGELGSFTRAGGLLDLRALEAEGASRMARSGAAGAEFDLDREVRTLSGGNQQKIVVTRALARLGASGVLVAAQPTRGVDIGASELIHARIREAAAAGSAILVLSSDLDELRALCSRILVLSRGRIVAELTSAATDEEFGRSMLGVTAKPTSGAPS